MDEFNPGLLPPSSAGIWGVLNGCGAWPLMTTTWPALPSSHREESGEASRIAHKMVSDYSRGVAPSFDPLDEKSKAASIYAEFCHNLMVEMRIFGGKYMGINEPITCPSIHEMCKGRCNFFIFDEPHLRLCVVSFRYRHTYVDEFDNPQLLCYDSGLMDRFSINGKSDQWLRVENTIIQPRCYQADPIRTHKFTALTRRAEFNKLASAAAEKIGGEGKCVPGPYCSECSAIYNCSAAFGSGIALYEAATQPSIADMEPTELSRRYGLILRAQERIKALANSYGSHIEAILHKGTVVPGYLLEDSFGNLDWSVPMAEVIALGELLGKNLKKDGVITPTQAKALGIDEATIAAYSTRKKQGRKLIPENKLTRKIEGALNG